MELCQKVIATAPPLLAPLLPPLLPPPPQAVSPAALITKAADTARVFLSFMRSVLFVEQQKMWSLPQVERNRRSLLTPARRPCVGCRDSPSPSPVRGVRAEAASVRPRRASAESHIGEW